MSRAVVRGPSPRWIAAWSGRAVGVVLLAHVFLYATSDPSSWRLAPIASVALCAIAGVLGILDSRLRTEELFLNSLGVPVVFAGSVWAGTAAMIEIAVGWLV